MAPTDKSGKLSKNIKDNYITSLESHVENDIEKIPMPEKDLFILDMEVIYDAYSRYFVKMKTVQCTYS